MLRSYPSFTYIPDEDKTSEVSYPWNKTQLALGFIGFTTHVVLIDNIKDIEVGFKKDIPKMQETIMI